MRASPVSHTVPKKVRPVECLNFSTLVCAFIKDILVHVSFLLFFTGTLAGGTNMGNVALWKYSPPLTGKVVDGEMKWKLQAPATVEGPIKQIRVRLYV